VKNSDFTGEESSESLMPDSLELITQLSKNKKVSPFVDGAKSWILDQAKKAKFAWSIIMTLAALLGYQVTIEPVIDNTESVQAIQAVVEESVQDVTESTKVVKVAVEESVQEIKQTVEESSNKVAESTQTVKDAVKQSSENIQQTLNIEIIKRLELIQKNLDELDKVYNQGETQINDIHKKKYQDLIDRLNKDIK